MEWFAQLAEVLPRGKAAGLRDVADQLEPRDAGLFVQAVALVNWHAKHTHCPRCGAPTDIAQGGHVRRCPQDGSVHFPRTDPAVIMLITDPAGGHALLGRQPSWPERRYSCLAGFVEPGESAERAVIRETFEETAVAVRDLRYVASQPWPFPASLMLGFRAIGDPAEPIDVGQDELADARWFSRAEIEQDADLLLPGPVSIARFMIEQWLAEK
jgi:NAD+ diphosphatase